MTTAPPAARIPPEQRVRAATLVGAGRAFSLAATRFPGMPLFAGHPPFQVLSYRTPHGLRVGGENLWVPTPNGVHLGCMTEIVSSSTHSGAHIDALAHMTLGEDAHWYGGANAAEHLATSAPRSATRRACRRCSPAGYCSTWPATAGSPACPRGARSTPSR